VHVAKWSKEKLQLTEVSIFLYINKQNHFGVHGKHLETLHIPIPNVPSLLSQKSAVQAN
jgi:hypothetical protein